MSVVTLLMLLVLIAAAVWALAFPMPRARRPMRAPDLRSYEPTKDRD